jgi:hypothetical protein
MNTNSWTPLHPFLLTRLALCAALSALCAPSLARAQAPAPAAEVEQFVPPQGSTIDIPMHAGTVCILTFPEKLSGKALSSSADFEIQPWSTDGIAIRVLNSQAAPATLALATATGQIKVNITLRVVPETEPALTLVRFKAVSEAEAFDAQVKTGIAKGIAPLEQRLEVKQKELERQQKELDALILKRADREVAERLLRRADVVKLSSHARNSDHVILHVWRGLLAGEDGFLVFEIQNRSKVPYQLASVRVLSGIRNVAGDTRLDSPVTVRDPALIGVVAPGASARGIVTLRPVQPVLRRELMLEVSGPKGRGLIRVDRGIVLR